MSTLSKTKEWPTEEAGRHDPKSRKDALQVETLADGTPETDPGPNRPPGG